MDVSLQAESGTGWKLLEEGVLHWEQWGEQFALYDALSGETHLLPEFSARLLQLLTATPLGVEALAESLCEYADEVCDQEFLGHVSQLLVQLPAAGLTEKVAL
jgi:PqqD family protein of HPr-rel-A system